MAQFGKASSKRSKPSYIYSIIGVALVLLIMGILGWIFLNFNAVGNSFKEDINISIYLRTGNQDTIAKIRQYIEAQPYAKNVEYITKEGAKKKWSEEGSSEDWEKILGKDNPLPESIDFHAKSNYVNPDSLNKLSADIISKWGNQVDELQYPRALVSTLSERTSKLGLIFIVVAAVLCTIVIVSIDNTIRLAMFSNRFLIKTMQMVGATRGFIARPMDWRAVLNGLLSSLIAIALLAILIGWAENQFEQLARIRDTKLTLILFGGMAVVGISISLFSTHRSVIKYLKMSLDDLY
jgi:cell division transport system permease protein